MESKLNSITRRALLASTAGFALSQAAASADEAAKTRDAVDEQAPKKLSEIRKEYGRLLPLWQVEREQFNLSSNTDDYWQGPHGTAIIALGPAIIPQLIQELRKGDFFFNVPLERLVNAPISRRG